MKAPRDEHRRLDSSKDHNESGLPQPHEGRIVEVFERISDAFYAVDCESGFPWPRGGDRLRKSVVAEWAKSP